ncbi:MAG TPA: FecR domain-containing protein [bacterium]
MKPIDYNELLSRYFSGEAGVEERARVEAWRRASAENQRLFAEYEKVWKSATEKLPKIPNIDQTWNELTAKLGLPAEPSPARILEMKKPPQPLARNFSWRDRYVWAAAAVILLALSITVYRTLQNSNGLKTIATANARQKNIELPDGSVVKLNSDSEIRFQKTFSDSTRSLTLAGEAYFEVARDGRPFVVKTGNAQIRVLGTKFNIRARNAETRVTVREGRVTLSGSASPPATIVVIIANQMSVCRQQNDPDPPTAVAADYVLGWLEGRIVFDQTPITEVVAELQRIYDVTIVLSNDAVSKHSITGSFQNKPVESVLTAICLALDLRYTKQAGKYVIGE